ncbi:hypothetical protein B296_00008526 [Ensete ventricosum]|uniref:Uncharacterized protein n=1 Tax=Ensete ventricosum TaxID=4639 RepID=A0A427AKV5_ENSVE|nr:hypothetical protein B296_00008526 [Ensete ventricosum]
MWRVTTTAAAAVATRGLLSARRASTKPTLDISSVSFSSPRMSSSVDGLAGGGTSLLFALRLHSAVDPLKPRLERASADFSTASPAEAAAMLGSLAPASSSISQMSRNVSEAIRHYGRCYWELSKARLSMLVVATSGTGFVLGSGSAIDIAGLSCTCAGTMMVAASANSLNQVA